MATVCHRVSAMRSTQCQTAAIATLLGLLPLPAITAGGQAPAPVAPSSDAASPPIESICAWFSSKPGQLYSNNDNPWVQDITFNTRFHWQYAVVDGYNETATERHDFSYKNRGEVRRFYFGPTIRFLDYFTLKAEGNFTNDNRPYNRTRRIDYGSMFELYLTTDLKKMLDPPGLDELRLYYGKYEQRYTEEHMTSSRDIYTVERSMLDAYLLPGVPVPSNPTGVWFEGKRGPHTLASGMFSTDHSPEIANWDDGRVYWITYRHNLAPVTRFEMAEVSANYIWNDSDATDQQAVNYDWASTLWGRIGNGPWALRGSLIYGANRLNTPDRGGYFSGIDILPTWWIVDQKFQFVMRGEYARATQPEGLRLAARYARIAGAPANEDLPSLFVGRGDRHYSLYAGFNYHFCANPHLKVMVGAEWERMENSATDLTVYDGTTLWVAFRTSF